VLLGDDAGLRCGEMALQWKDVDLHKRQLCVQRSDRKGHVTVPKGGRRRYVPLTIRLMQALRGHRHLRSECVADASPMSADIVKHHVERAARRAQLGDNGVHRLRHTFCSHLAMRGAPARAILELAGHKDLADHAAVHAPQPRSAR
jgi:integrase